MFQTFRLSMTWLHTWFGLVLGYVLMIAFFFGTLSVFDVTGRAPVAAVYRRRP